MSDFRRSEFLKDVQSVLARHYHHLDVWSDSPAFVKYLARVSAADVGWTYESVDVMALSGGLADVCTKHGRRMAETIEIVFCARVTEVSIRLKADRLITASPDADTDEPRPVQGSSVAAAVKRSFGKLVQGMSGVVDAGRRVTKYVKRAAESLTEPPEAEAKVDLNLFRNLSLGPEAVDAVVRLALETKYVLLDNADEAPLAGLQQNVRREKSGQFFVIEIDTDGLYRVTLDDFLVLKRHVDGICEHPTTARVFYAEGNLTAIVRVTVRIKPFKDYDAESSTSLVPAL